MMWTLTILVLGAAVTSCVRSDATLVDPDDNEVLITYDPDHNHQLQQCVDPTDAVNIKPHLLQPQFPAHDWTDPMHSCILGENNKVLSGNFTLTTCKHICQGETAFDCRSVEYYSVSGSCSLSNATSNSPNYRIPCPNIGVTLTEVTRLWRADTRCGVKFMLPNGSPSPCNPDGEYPCCSEKGWCGNSPYHCDCPDCTDYRRIPTTGNSANLPRPAAHPHCVPNSKDTTGHVASQPAPTSSTPPVSNTNCGEVFTSRQGILRHPVAGVGYQNNEDCVWVISPGVGPIYITFTRFNTQIRRDFLYIRDGAHMKSEVLERLSGTRLPDVVHITSNAAHLHFTSDATGNRTGFELTWDAPKVINE